MCKIIVTLQLLPCPFKFSEGMIILSVPPLSEQVNGSVLFSKTLWIFITARKSFPSEICLLNKITIFERCHIAILLTFPGKNIIASKFLLIDCVLSGQIGALVIRRQQKKFNSRSLRPGTKGFNCRKWAIGYNFGIDDGPESKFGTHKEFIALNILEYKYCVNKSRDLSRDHFANNRKSLTNCWRV